MKNLKIALELLHFLKQEKKWWLMPLVVIFLLIGALMLFVQTSPLAPFLYSLF
ncbi:MAG: DUF5989 family protein [Blastocatellia bacterium]|nr:DUF5989 family protein [Blastocatellia bacterium]